MDVFELKGTIKIEGAEEVKKTIKDTAASVDDSTKQMEGSSESLAAEFDKNTEQINEDFKKLEKNIKDAASKIEANLTKMYNKMAIAGAAVTAAITAVGIKASENAQDISNWSIKLGISTGAVQELSYVARQNSIDLNSMGMAIRQQSNFVMEAAQGNQSYIDTLDKIGLSYQQLQGLNPEEQFWAIAEAVGELGTTQERTSTAMDIWGGLVGQSLLPLIDEGSAGIAGMRDRYHELNAEMSDEQIAKLTSLNDTWKDFKTTMESFANTMGATVAPVLDFVFNKMLIPMFSAVETVLDVIPAPLKDIGAGFILAAAGAFTFIGGLGSILRKMPEFKEILSLGWDGIKTFSGYLAGGVKALIGFAAELIKTGAKFIVYVAKLIPVIVAQSWAMATNFPVGTAAFIALMAAGGAAIYGIVKGIQALGAGGGGEATPEGVDFDAATTEATTLTESGGEIPEAASGGTFSGPQTGYLVKLHGTEKVTKINESTSTNSITINVEKMQVRDDNDILRIAEQLDILTNRRLRAV